MVTLGKWHSGPYIQGDHYIQVNFAENKRKLKILESCPVTVIYRVTAIYRALLGTGSTVFHLPKTGLAPLAGLSLNEDL